MTAKKQAPKRPAKKAETAESVPTPPTPEEQAQSILVQTRAVSSGGLYHVDGESVIKNKE